MTANTGTGRILAISDIHACYTTFMTLIEQLRLQRNDNLFITGDMINRGKDTKKLIKTLIALKKDGFHIFPTRGNHEEELISAFTSQSQELVAIYTKYLALTSKTHPDKWLIKKDGTMKSKYFAFFTELPYFYSVENVYFVHGGFNFSLTNPFEDTHSMVHYRKEYNEQLLPPNMRIVHGHTPTPLGVIEQSVANNSRVINIDNGCVMKKSVNFGNLVCLDVRAMELFVQPNVE